MVEGNQTPDNTDQSNSSQNNSRPYGDMYWVYIIGAWSFIGLLLVAVFWPNMTERLKFFVGTLWVIVTAFAVIAQAVIYRKQWAIMERQWRLSRHAMEYAEAAYVTVLQVQMTKKMILGEHAQTKILFGNFGNTPAFNLGTHGHMDLKPIGSQFTDQEALATGPGNVSKTILGGRGATTMQTFNSGMPLTPELLAVIEQHKLVVHVWGIVTYTDVFKRERWTRFCFSEIGNSGEFESCPCGNDTDDQQREGDQEGPPN
jgi:hypothetical protein